MTVERADICVVACAEAFRGDGEIVCSPMGTTPRLGALLAWSTFEPDLLISDGQAQLLAEPVALGAEEDAPKEAWLPFQSVFDVVAAGTRHVMMGATQVDRFGNQNISAIGDHDKPTVQLLGARGAPGNTVNHATSYWVPNHSPKVFVAAVDYVSGVGTDRAAGQPEAARFHRLHRVVTNLAVLDLGGPDGTMRLLSVHPGVTVDDVIEATGFVLASADDVTETRAPTVHELAIIDRLDPNRARFAEVPRAESA